MGPLGLIVNGKARAVRRRHLGTPFWNRQLPTDLVRLTQDLDDLDRAVVAFRDAGVEVVAVLGGDGTAHHGIDAMIRHYDEWDLPALLVLAGGTSNGVPRALGSGGPPERVLGRALAALSEPELPVRSLRVLRVMETATGRARHGIGFAAGSVYPIYQRYYRHPDPGLVQAIGASVAPLLSVTWMM